MLLTIAVAIAIPLVFLYAVHWLDLYGSDRPRTVYLCFAWGSVAFLLAVLVNRFSTDIVALGHAFVGTRTAPFVEEILKSLILIYLVRRANFTYFVDSAIYGFASGIGFAVIENLRYIQLYPDQALTLVITRDFSTALMHGTGTALIGIALGRFRLARGNSGILSLMLGWGGAMALHYSFNNVALSNLDPILTEWILVGIGLGGVALVAATILWGLREESKWLREELSEKLHVSGEEATIIQHMGELDELLSPIEKRFGKSKRNQVATFLHLEAQLGLKQRAEEKTSDPKLQAELASQIAISEEELDRERSQVGVYVMSFVRSILPPADWSLWTRLGQALTKPQDPGTYLWNALATKMALPITGGGTSLYTRLQEELQGRAQAATLTLDHVNDLPEAMQECMYWVMKKESAARHLVVAGLGHEEQVTEEILSQLVARGFLHRTKQNGQTRYRSRLATPDEPPVHLHIWRSLLNRLSAHPKRKSR